MPDSFCCLNLYHHSQDHSKSRPANSNPGHSHHPPSPSRARSRSLFKTLWTQYFVKCNKTIKTHKNVFFFSVFLLGHLPTTTTNCRNLNFSCSVWWTLTLSSENAASGQAAGGKFLNNILICASNQVAKCLNYKLLENLNLQFSEQILRPLLCQLSANPLLKWKLTFCKQLLIGGKWHSDIWLIALRAHCLSFKSPRPVKEAFPNPLLSWLQYGSQVALTMCSWW